MDELSICRSIVDARNQRTNGTFGDKVGALESDVTVCGGVERLSGR